MVNINPLYSSSSGNLFHINTAKTNILLDVGVSYKAINEGLKSIDTTISDINAILITHEHVDHIKGLPLLCRKNNIPVYACGKTADYLSELLASANISANVIKVNYNEPFKIRDIEITPFETSHDAVMPCGYKIKNENYSLAFATDLGYVSNEVYDNLTGSDFVVLESNYDKTMLEFGTYPFPLKRRIKSVTGHLSNEDCANTIAKLIKDNSSTKFLLAHLSEKNNDQSVAKFTMEDVLLKNDINVESANISFASKSLSNEVFSIC